VIVFGGCDSGGCDSSICIKYSFVCVNYIRNAECCGLSLFTVRTSALRSAMPIFSKAIDIIGVCIISGVGNVFHTADRFQPGSILRTGPQQHNECLAHISQLVSHHGTDSVRDLSLLCRNKMLRPVWIMLVNDTAVCSLCQSFQSLLDQFGLGSARPGKNFFTDRHRAATLCLSSPAIYDTVFRGHQLGVRRHGRPQPQGPRGSPTGLF